MSAAIINLVSKGVQDAYITGDPQVSFFRQNYKRHTNFSLRPERIDYIGTFGSNNEVVIPIKSKGDLLSYVWVEASAISAISPNTSGFYTEGEAPTDFTLMIGGQPVCRLDSQYIQCVHNILYNENQAQTTMALSGDQVAANALNMAGEADHYVIPFFFSQDWTKCLPLAAMQYHEVEIRIKCRNGFVPNSTPRVYAMYAYLDTDERKFLVESDHEILITQTQFQPGSLSDTEFDLTYFNHPTKAIHLVADNVGTTPSLDKWNEKYTFDDATVYINGTPLFENMTPEFHHSVVPRMHSQFLPQGLLETAPVFTWPFCLNLNKSQPTGSMNFSRLDTAKLHVRNPRTVSGGSTGVRVYAVNYNILRIKNGMAGVAFSN